MARVVSPDRVLSAPVSLASDFYREEFIRHRECLKRQREYFSERAITDADHALALVLGHLEQLCAQDGADQLMCQLLKKFNAVTGLSGWSDPTASLTDSLKTLRADLQQILRAGVSNVDPFHLVRAALSRGVLDRLSNGPVSVVSAGKAAWPMALALADARSSGQLRTDISGLITGPRVGSSALPPAFEWFDASHPSPDAASEAAGRRALALAEESRSRGGLLVLLSGGASALMAAPADGLSLADKMLTARALMNAGAAIAELNCVRNTSPRSRADDSQLPLAERSRSPSPTFTGQSRTIRP
jgi:hypothetical protein